MKPIYYNTNDRWGHYWRELGQDSSDLDELSYSLFPAIKYLKKDGLILECGCGLGRLVKWLTKNNFDVVGMDIEEYSISKLKRDLPPSKCIRSNASALPFNPDFAIETQHRDDKEGCRFGRKKCAHTLEYVSAFF